MGCISFKLPSFDALAGGVLRHCVKTIDGLIDNQYPLIFKIGFTHNCVWRWANSLYGYQMSVDNFSHMDVLYIATEPFSVAMLEAALIEKYQGTLTMPFGIEPLSSVSLYIGMFQIPLWKTRLGTGCQAGFLFANLNIAGCISIFPFKIDSDLLGVSQDLYLYIYIYYIYIWMYR